MTLEEFEARESILQEVIAERDAQGAKWGGPEHDDLHDTVDWANFIMVKTDAVYEAGVAPYNPSEKRRRLIQIAALAVAAVESHDRQQRGDNNG